MATSESFPRELLSQPADVRLAYFAGKVVAHPRLKETHEALLSAIRRPTGASLIIVFGPTGVGKTTLRLRIEKQLIETALPDMAKDPGHIPVVGLEATASESGQFNWRDYYIRALMALDEPLVKDKIECDQNAIQRDGADRSYVGRAPVSALRRALEQCLRQRRLMAFIVDEAQHLKKMASGRRLLDQMDTLKSLAAMTGTPHVLIGTYELLGLANLSAQLSRRSIDIHFCRYQPDVAEDLLAFKSVLLTFQRHLPLAVEPDLVGRHEYLYEGSVGCVGVLKNWLNRALAAVLEEGGTPLAERDLEGQAEPTRKLLSLAREIKEGEEALLGGEWERDELRMLLGMTTKASRAVAAKPEPEAGQRSEGMTSRRRAGRVGQRRPVRDPVGGVQREHVG